jgi:hypothetical protein
MLTIESKEVEQGPKREREHSLDSRHWWPGYLIGYLPEDLDRLRRPDPTVLRYPLKDANR